MSQRAEYVKSHKKNATFEVSCQILNETDKAYKIWDGTGLMKEKATWVPKSQIVNITKTEKKDIVNIEMSEWIAKEKGFI